MFQIVTLTFSGEISDKMTKVNEKTPTFATNTAHAKAKTGTLLMKAVTTICSINWVIIPKIVIPTAMFRVAKISKGLRPSLSTKIFALKAPNIWIIPMMMVAASGEIKLTPDREKMFVTLNKRTNIPLNCSLATSTMPIKIAFRDAFWTVKRKLHY